MKTKRRCKIKFWLTIALLLTLSSISSAEEYAPGEILVKFKGETKKQEAKAANNLRWKLDAKEIQKFVINNVRHLELPAGVSVEHAILEAYKNPDVQYAEPNYILHANKIPNDPMYNQLWGMEKIQAPQAWDITTGSSQIIVAVIDTGVDYNHPDISANMWKGSNGEYGYDFHNNDGDPMDDQGHGTHVAGTIGAVGNNNLGVTGVNWNVKIMALKFLGGDGSGYLSNAIRAIEYAVKNGAKITSNSYGGGGYSQAFADAITASHNAGLLFVAAAGNDGTNNDNEPHYPASYDVPNIISVAASDQSDNLAYFSCYGKNSVDLAAPGVAILSTTPGNQYGTKSGTSMATPHVSGVCALIWAQNPNLTNLEAKDKLLQSVDQIPSLLGKVLTNGRLNVYKALQGGGTPPPEPPSPPPPEPKPPGGNTIFYDDMEKGLNGWTVTGYDALWHQTQKRYTSSNTSWYYGIETTMNYDTGWINFGSLISPTISLKNISGTECTLTFNYWREVEYYEDIYDVTSVMISTDGGAWWNILWWMDSTNPSTKKWEQVTISLNDYIGQDIILAFIFNTIDYSNNFYEGWYIDDVMIANNGGSEPPPAKQPNIEIEPKEIPTVEITKDQTAQQTLKIKNTGEADLNYTISDQKTAVTEISPYEPESNKEAGPCTLNTTKGPASNIYSEESLTIDNTQWQVIWNKKTGTAHRAYGGSIKLSSLNEQSARDFIEQHYDLFKVHETDLKLERDEIHSHQRYITFQQMYNEIPVYNAKVELRYSTKTGQLILFGSDAYPDINISITPNITASEAQKATGETGEIRSTELIIFPTDEQIFLAYEVIIFTENPAHLWIYIINALDASIITRWDAIKSSEITGTVKGKVHSFYFTDGQILEEFTNEKVNISGTNSSYTNKDGYYTAPISDTNNHTVTTNLSGPYVSITNKSGSNASYSGTSNSNNPHNIQWDDSNSNVTERDVYYHIQLANKKIKEIDPSFKGVDYQAPAEVNYPNLSNAYFEGYGYRFGDGKDPNEPMGNFGQMADIIYHEYGHGIMHFQYNQNWDNSLEFGSMHEGFADYFACTITNEPLQGEGLMGSYPGRNIDEPNYTPSNTEPEVHERGKVIAGALWDLRKELGAGLTDHLFHFARYGHALNFRDYYIDLLLEDDNDGNYNNGTPHSQEIYSSFALHEIAYVNPQDPNDTTPPAKVNDLKTVNSTYNTITLQWTSPGDDGTVGQAHSYDIRYSTTPITDSNWNETKQLLGEPYPKKAGTVENAKVCGIEPDTTYYFAIKTRDNNGNWSTLSNIASAKTQASVAIYANDMEGDTSGWTTDCTWEVVNNSGHSGTRCWTDTPNGNYSNTTNCSLISPSFDLSTAKNTSLNFWHKHYLEKDYDIGYIEVSTNNAIAWETVKMYTGENPDWTNTVVDLSPYDGYKDVKIRFRLHSNYTGTYDGWYIDDVKILTTADTTTLKWLTYNPKSGTVPSGSAETITLTYGAKGLKEGTYETTLNIQSNDPDTPQIQLTVKMTVKENTDLPPNAPTGLKATSGDKQVDLSWNANNETDLAGYNIYRKDGIGTTSTRIMGKSLCDIEAKLNKSLNLVKVFLINIKRPGLAEVGSEGPASNIDKLISQGIAVYENMGIYAIAEVTNEELDILTDAGFTYKILDTDSQTKQYFVIQKAGPWWPDNQPDILKGPALNILDIEDNTAIIHTDPQTALQLPQLGLQIRPIRRRPLLLGEQTIVSYEFSLADTPKQTLIKEMVSKAQEGSVKNYLQTLQNFGTRYSYANGYGNATQWAYNQFKQMGLEVSYHQFSINGYNTNNVVATLKSTTKPDEIFIICGHLDCTSENPEASAPGAEDNGSGATVVLEVARILSQYKFDSTIKFILFGGEEQGLYGSYAYANEMADKGANILGVLNFDMIAYLDTPDKDLKIYSHTSWQQLAQIIIQSASTYTTIQAYNVPDNTMSRSDHWYFWQRNYPAIMGWENDKSHFYPYYHTTNDTIDKISPSFAAEVAKLGISSLAELANPVISTPPPLPAPSYKKINNTLITSTNYKDTTVINNTTYMYIVTAVDKAGNESSYSNEVSATPKDKTPEPPKPEPSPNLALTATASASSEYSSAYKAGNAIDGIIGQWDKGEWASQGWWDRTPWLRLNWTTPQTVNKIVIYGRPNKYDSIQNARITLSNGYTMTLGEIPIGGAAKEIYFPTTQISWLEFKVLETKALNPGLTEIEVYYKPTDKNNSNLAQSASATASSEYSSAYKAGNAIDGIIGQWDSGEWAAQGSWDRTPWLRLNWTTPQTVNKIVIYGRPNKYDSIQNAKITLSNGYTMTLGEIPIGGAAKEIYFPTAQISWLEFKVLETNALNPGLTEIEVYYEPKNQNNSNLAQSANATASSEYSTQYKAGNAIDEIIGQWDKGEWAAQGSWDRTPWLKLSWSNPQTVNKIVIYGRPNKYDSIQNAKITFSNGYTMTIGEIPIGGAAKEIYFPTMQITWLKFEVLETNAWNAGLTEIEVYYTGKDTSFYYNEPTPEKDSITLTKLNKALDTDGDGIYDKFDAFDLDPCEWEDTDGDSIGNNMDWDDDDDEILDEEDAYPLDIKSSTLKNNPAKLARLELILDNIPDIDTIFLTIPEDVKEDDIKTFVKTAHSQKTLIIPFITTKPEIKQIESIIDTVIENDYDGIVTEETNTDFIKNLSSALHNKGKQLVISITYSEELNLYDIEPYIDKLIIKASEEETESAILDIRLQVPEEKIIIEVSNDIIVVVI